MSSISCTISVSLAAPPDTVFRALTEPRRIKAWSGQKGKVEGKPGGKFELFDGWVRGTVVSFDPPRSFTVTWYPADWPEGTEPSTVIVTLSKDGKRTKVNLVHTGFPSREEMASHKKGWSEFVFGPLKSYLSEL